MAEPYGLWIRTDDWTEADAHEARLVCYRAEADFSTVPDTFWIHCSADTRYKLYVNGRLVQLGPAKGDDKVWYYDRIDLAPWLAAGENAIAFEVLHYPADRLFDSNHSLFRRDAPALYLSCAQPLRWRSRVMREVSFCAEAKSFAPLHIHEKVSAVPSVQGWKRVGYDDRSWSGVTPLSSVPEGLRPERLKLRPIPFMDRAPRRFAGMPAAPLVVPAHEEYSLVLDAGEEMTGFVRLALSGGTDARISLLYSECYVIPVNGGYEKRRRADSAGGVLTGFTDHYTVAGSGSPEAPEIYEPFWFRTFRFVRLTVRTGACPLAVCSLDYEETGYPLDAGTRVETSDPSMKAIWDISLRSLRRCMQETYTDCPFYEQLQYTMDTRSQILYTYAVSADDRLARNAIDDFSRGQHPKGLLNSCYPNVNSHVIPGFSVYYILMVHDHMMYFGDRGLVRQYMPVILRILDFFRGSLTAEGLVGKVGGILGQAPFWSFIDWAKEWMPYSGMPEAGLYGPLTMESLLYLLGLQRTADLADFLGDPETAADCLDRAERLRAAVRACCITPDGMISDGPGRSETSQHCQVFGVLTGVLSPEDGKRCLLKTIGNDAVPRCSVAMCFYLFRALERTGLYSFTDRYWDIWRGMVSSGCTTCVEAEDHARSECHGWGALALYELPSVVLGVRPAARGYGKISVSPVPGILSSAAGTVRTPRGDISVSWTAGEGISRVCVRCGDALKKDLIVCRDAVIEK